MTRKGVPDSADEAHAEMEAIHAALGHGADEDAWPPGLTIAEAIARLGRERDDALRRLAFWSEVDQDPLGGWCGRHPRRVEAATVGMIGGDTADGADLCLACEVERLTRELLARQAAFLALDKALREDLETGALPAPDPDPTNLSAGITRLRVKLAALTHEQAEASKPCPAELAASVLACPEALWAVADALPNVRMARWRGDAAGFEILESSRRDRLAWVGADNQWRGDDVTPAPNRAVAKAEITAHFRAAGWVIP